MGAMRNTATGGVGRKTIRRLAGSPSNLDRTGVTDPSTVARSLKVSKTTVYRAPSPKLKTGIFACFYMAVLNLYAVPPAFAQTYQLVDPFSRQSILQFDWKKFPTQEQRSKLDPYMGEQNKNVDWKFLYTREFKSEFGKGNERIQVKISNDGMLYRISFSYLDDAYPNKCTNAGRKLEAAIGPPNGVVDKSHSTKVLLSEKSDATMDWHTVNFRKQWSVGKTMIGLYCLGHGSQEIKEAILTIFLSEKATTKKLHPILWLTCDVVETIRYRDGETRQKRIHDFDFGVDLNESDVIRLDNSPIDFDAKINERTIAFTFGKKMPIPLIINRYTASIVGQESITLGQVSADIGYSGKCKRFSKGQKKF